MEPCVKLAWAVSLLCLLILALCASPVHGQQDDLLQTIYRNLLTVIDGSQVSSTIKDRIRSEFRNVFSPTNTKKLAAKADEKGIVEAIHDSAHDVIDNLNLATDDVITLHSSVHHVFSATFVGSSCYPSFTPKHTGCLKDDACARVRVKSGISEPEKNLIIDSHNRIRSFTAVGETPGEEDDFSSLDDILSKFQPKAAKMKEMVWDIELAHLAQKWANQCQARVDCTECRRVPRFAVGQNVFHQMTRRNQTSPRWSVVLQRWLDGRKKFPHDLVYRYEHSNSWAAYTQLVWDTTYRVGCGYSSFYASGGIRHLFVCNYGPIGNIPGQPVYATGRPCSKCPRGHICNSDKLCTYGSPPSGFNPLLPAADVSFPPAFLPTSTTTTTTTMAPPSTSTNQQSLVVNFSVDETSQSNATSAAQLSSNKDCRQGCVPLKYLNFCNYRTFRKGTDCPDQHICCSLMLPPIGFSQPEPATYVRPATTSSATKSALPPQRCPGECVKLPEANKRCRGAIDYRITSCKPDEACCTRRPDDFLSVDTIGASVPLATSELEDVSINRRSSFPCPDSYACLPRIVSGLCNVGTIMEDTVCSQSGHVCCLLGPMTDDRCSGKYSCVPKVQAGFACSGNSVDESKKCPSSDMVCCMANGTFGFRPVSALLDNTLQPLALGGSGPMAMISQNRRKCEDPGSECLPRYNTPRCESRPFAREFTELFSCEDSGMTCCAPVSRIKAALYEPSSRKRR